MALQKRYCRFGFELPRNNAKKHTLFIRVSSEIYTRETIKTNDLKILMADEK